MKHSLRFPAIVCLAAFSAAVAICQAPPTAPPPNGPGPRAQNSGPRGWRRVTDAPPPSGDQLPPATAESTEAPATTPGDMPPVSGTPVDPSPGYRPLDAYGQSRDEYGNQSGYPQQQPMPRRAYAPPPEVPPELTIRPGTYLTVRIDQPLSSDHNHAGDAFSATLVKPLVIDGVVVAQRGQTLGGRVVEAVKAGRVEGVSRLGLEIIDLGIADGQQVPVKTQFVGRSGQTSIGRDVGAVGGTMAAGAAVGASVNGGVGAGVGAAAGLVAGTIGVLLTRGHATVIYPESVLTFRIESPINISTVRGAQAFRYVDPRDYERADNLQQRYQARGVQGQPAPYYGAPYYGPYYRPYYYGAGLYPYYPFYGGLSFYYGPRFYGGRGFYRGGGYSMRGYRR